MSRKVLGAVALHYGKDYLWHALNSIKDHVDEIVIYYTSEPSYGHRENIKCPDSRDELKAITDQFSCTWQEISQVGQENKHREHYIKYAEKRGYDQILIVDSDEIHVNTKIPKLLESAWETNVKRVGVNGDCWVTLWRSFNEYVQDGFAPVRVINVNQIDGQKNVSEGFIYHMGYSITNEMMEYKISCHGHAADFQKNKGWLRDKWHGYQKGVTQKLHPATDAYWIETKDFDKETLPESMKDHPFYNLDRIT
jgi:hypothetical protein